MLSYKVFCRSSYFLLTEARNFMQRLSNLTVKGRAVPNPVNIHPKFEQKLNVSLKARAWMIVQTNRPSNSSARISERD